MARPVDFRPFLTPFGFRPTVQDAVDCQLGVPPEGVRLMWVLGTGHGPRGVTEEL